MSICSSWYICYVIARLSEPSPMLSWQQDFEVNFESTWSIICFYILRDDDDDDNCDLMLMTF